MIREGIEENERLANMPKSDYDEDEVIRQVLEMSLREENDKQKKLASIKGQAAKKPNVVPVTAHVPEPDLRKAVIIYRPVPFLGKNKKNFEYPTNLHTTPYELISPITTIQFARHWDIVCFEYYFTFLDAEGKKVNKCDKKMEK